MKKSKKKKAVIIIAIILIILMIVWWYNNFTLKITYTSITSAKISEPLTLAVLSDLHASKSGISNEKILDKIEKINPDLVFVLGDMYTRRSSQNLIDIPVELMQSMVDSGYSVYFVQGDHDTSIKYFDKLENSGVHVMNYAEEVTEVNSNKLHIMGINNVFYSSTFDLSREFSLYDDCYNILLAHIPNYEKFSQFGADLTLCADTHGGIIQIPFIGAAYDVFSKKFLPQLFSDYTVYDKGWFDYKGGAMFITSGIGAYPIAARFNNRPEVVSIKIIPEVQK